MENKPKESCPLCKVSNESLEVLKSKGQKKETPKKKGFLARLLKNKKQ